MVTKHEIPRVFFQFFSKMDKKMSKKANPKKVLGKINKNFNISEYKSKNLLKDATMGDQIAFLRLIFINLLA
jgi:hypothetical protein